jgi:hypothetical protein
MNWNSDDKHERAGNTGEVHPIARNPLRGMPLWVLGGMALLVGGPFWAVVFAGADLTGRIILGGSLVIGMALASVITARLVYLLWTGKGKPYQRRNDEN